MKVRFKPGVQKIQFWVQKVYSWGSGVLHSPPKNLREWVVLLVVARASGRPFILCSLRSATPKLFAWVITKEIELCQ